MTDSNKNDDRSHPTLSFTLTTKQVKALAEFVGLVVLVVLVDDEHISMDGEYRLISKGSQRFVCVDDYPEGGSMPL